MQGKWNMRISGITLNNTPFQILEIYFNLGYQVNIGDVLSFGNMGEFAQDLQIRLNTIGNSYYIMGCGGAFQPTELQFNTVDITDTNKSINFVQTVGTNPNTATASGKFRYIPNGTYKGEFATAYSAPLGFNYDIEAFSPFCALHDEFNDNILIVSSSVFGAVFTSNIPFIQTNHDVPSVTEFPIPHLDSRMVEFDIVDLTSNIFEKVNPSDSDPYNPNGTHAGGDGEEQNADEMADETLPTISASDTGFVTLYKPSISQMNALANYMWNTLDLDVFKKVIANPMDVILGLSILPGIVPSGGSSSVRVGNIDTGVSMTKVGNQYVKFNCGSVTIKRKWGAFLDYSPFTKAFIYLPFIGVQPIDVDEIMNKTVSVTYNIDVLSGGCCAFIKVDGTTLYTYIGQCACSVPVTGKDWSTMINGVLGAVSSIGGTIGSIASGNVAGAISGVAAVAQNVMGAKPTYQRSGTMGGMGGMMGIKTPYIIIERPVQAVPGYQNQIIGYPSFITRMIGEFKGYTEIEQCHLENIPCTKDEMIEIENILKTGVIL